MGWAAAGALVAATPRPAQAGVKFQKKETKKLLQADPNKPKPAKKAAKKSGGGGGMSVSLPSGGPSPGGFLFPVVLSLAATVGITVVSGSVDDVLEGEYLGKNLPVGGEGVLKDEDGFQAWQKLHINANNMLMRKSMLMEMG